ncbi:MAG: DNA recombination/repair protein RecA, partial [Clostridia bacterium]|nr:DNA recombination/repair protein RecA [Clostridia bacterium]
MKDVKRLNYVTDDKQKKEALDAMFAQMEKQFGKGAVMRLGEKGIPDIEVVSTGSIGIDA